MRVIWPLLLASVWGSPALAGEAPQRRALNVNDLFELEGIAHGYGGPFAFSPDGRSLAFTRLRPRKTLADHQREFLIGNDRGDVWLQEKPGDPPVNLTRGQDTASGWWAPQWSPDGRWLAMLSTRDGRIRLWGWKRASAELVRLVDREVELVDYDRPPFAWVSNDRILLPVVAGDTSRAPIESDLHAAPRLAAQGWGNAKAGTKATVSVLRSAGLEPASAPSRGELLLVDVGSGDARALVSASTSGWSPAPHGGAVAIARRTEVYRPKPGEPLPLRRIAPTPALGRWAVEVHFLDGRAMLDTGAAAKDAQPQSIRWSDDGRELAFLAFDGARPTTSRLFRIDVNARQVAAVELGPLDLAPRGRSIAQIHWLPSGDLMVAAALSGGGVDARRDWWLLTRDGRQRRLTADMRVPPRELWAGRESGTFFGSADGALWKLRPRSGILTNLTAGLEGSVEGMEWPVALAWDDRAQYAPAGARFADLFFSMRKSGDRRSHRLDTGTGRIMPLASPGEGAGVVGFASATRSVLQAVEGDEGTAIWRSSVIAPGTADTLMEANTFLKQISTGPMRQIEYVGLDGQALRAWLILPHGAESGRRHPLLTWVHAGFVAGPEPAYHHRLSYADALNLHVAAAQGYAVLLPSMPVRTPGDADDALLGLPNGVLPAVQRAVDLGLADETRLFLGGHSFGGYSTYGLVGLTQRFKAAVSLAGMSNLVSLYGTFDARLRYGDHPHENLTNITRMEAGQTNVGGPPWEDLGRYVRNSPIGYVETMRTPLLIVQGDLDFVPIQQGEEVFTSLYRLGRRAEFARYWGEGHELRSPANIRDMWSRVFAWFDELGDIARDDEGRIRFDGDRPRSREGAPAWTSERFLRLEQSRWDRRGEQGALP
jgi:dipeptidyl aminopeptidase/acylaminoacyl peptidase